MKSWMMKMGAKTTVKDARRKGKMNCRWHAKPAMPGGTPAAPNLQHYSQLKSWKTSLPYVTFAVPDNRFA